MIRELAGLICYPSYMTAQWRPLKITWPLKQRTKLLKSISLFWGLGPINVISLWFFLLFGDLCYFWFLEFFFFFLLLRFQWFLELKSRLWKTTWRYLLSFILYILHIVHHFANELNSCIGTITINFHKHLSQALTCFTWQWLLLFQQKKYVNEIYRLCCNLSWNRKQMDSLVHKDLLQAHSNPSWTTMHTLVRVNLQTLFHNKKKIEDQIKTALSHL